MRLQCQIFSILDGYGNIIIDILKCGCWHNTDIGKLANSVKISIETPRRFYEKQALSVQFSTIESPDHQKPEECQPARIDEQRIETSSVARLF